jgi:glycosyltransferase involved in cell wall biosynthesis
MAMNILHVIDSGGLYGAEVMLLNLMSEQVRLGLVPTLSSIGKPNIVEKPLETEAIRRGLRVEKIRMRPGPNIAGALKLLRFACREKIDIIHSHGYKGNILLGLMPRFLRRLPMVTTLHGWTWTGDLDRMVLYEGLDRLSLHFIDKVVVVNDAMRSRVKIKDLHVVDNGIPLNQCDISEIPEDEEPQIDPEIASFCNEGFTIGAIGRLSPEKGFQILLEAFKTVEQVHPEARLLILGEGSERNALEAKIKRLRLEKKVFMPGYVADARRYIPLFRVYVLSSLTEGLPMVVLEAMQAGVPIVATMVGGIPAVLGNGQAGILVPAHSPSDLAEGIMRVLNDQCLVESMTKVARNLLQSRYSSTAMAINYSGIYSGLLRNCH